MVWKKLNLKRKIIARQGIKFFLKLSLCGASIWRSYNIARSRRCKLVLCFFATSIAILPFSILFVFEIMVLKRSFIYGEKKRKKN